MKDYLEFLTKLIAAATAVIVAFRYIYTKYFKPFCLNRKKNKRLIIEQAQIISEMPEKVALILKQLYPNGGGSVIDKLDDMKKQIGTIELKLDNFEDQQKFILNMQGVAFWLSGDIGECVYVSPSTCKLLQRSESELLRFEWVSCLCKNDIKRISEECYASIRVK
jgi:PAS domain-containing protein